MIDKLDLNTKAQQLREALGEDANSPVDIFALANQICGLTVVFYPLGENISGMCVRDKAVKLIAVNSSMSYGRQRFSMAHELYHLYYDDVAGFNVCAKKFDPKSDIEKCADQFASYFIAPYGSLLREVNRIKKDEKLTLAQVIALEQYFGMSHQAMLWRLISEGFLTTEDANAYSYGVRARARNMGYDEKLYLPSPEGLQKRTYGHYIKQVEELQQKDLISAGKIDELLLDAYRDDIVFGDDIGGEVID